MGRPASPVQLTGGYLGSTESPTPFQAGETPIDYLKPPPGLTREERNRQMEALDRLNREFHERYSLERDIAARVRSYE
jgi:hypothetical protein